MRLLGSILALCLIATLGGGLTWWIVGPPDRSVPCVQSELKEGEVCLKTVLEWGDDQILWLDARPRDEWKENGLKHALLFNDQKEESLDDLDEAFMMVQGVSPKPNVVVYCNTEGCGSSTIVAKHLREDFAEMLGFKVWVLHGGWKALAAEGLTQ